MRGRGFAPSPSGFVAAAEGAWRDEDLPGGGGCRLQLPDGQLCDSGGHAPRSSLMSSSSSSVPASTSYKDCT